MLIEDARHTKHRSVAKSRPGDAGPAEDDEEQL